VAASAALRRARPPPRGPPLSPEVLFRPQGRRKIGQARPGRIIFHRLPLSRHFRSTALDCFERRALIGRADSRDPIVPPASPPLLFTISEQGVAVFGREKLFCKKFASFQCINRLRLMHSESMHRIDSLGQCVFPQCPCECPAK